MAEAIKIDLRIGDISSIQRAVSTVVQSATKTALSEAKKAAAGRVAAEKAAASTIARDQATAAKAGLAAQKAAAKEGAAIQKAAAKDVANAQKAAARDAANFQAEMDRASARNFKQRVAEQANAQKAAARDAANFQAEMDRASARNFKQRVAEQDRASRRARSDAAREEASIAKVANVGRGVGRAGLEGAGAGLRRGAGLVAGVGAMAAGGLGLGMVASAVQAQMGLGERSALLQNSSGRNLDFTKMSKSISGEVGVDAGEIMGGFEKVAGKSGGEGIDQVKDKMLELAKVARGAGVNMTDLGDVVATLVNRGVKAEDLVKTVQTLVQQGKDGAVEFKDLATMLDESSGALMKFKMGTGDRISTAGGLSQIARTFGQKSAAEATTSVMDLGRDIGGKADIIQKLTGGSATTVHVKGKKTRKMVDGKMVETTEGDSTQTRMSGGVEVGTDATRSQMRDINTLLPEIIMGAIAKGNAGKLLGEGGVFTGTSTAIASPLIQAATQGISKNASGRYGITQDGETADLRGGEAIKAMLAQFQNATVDAATSERDFANVMRSDGAKMSQAMARLKNEMGDKLAPVINAQIPNIIALGKAFGDAVGFFAEKPKTAIAGFLAFTTALGAAQGALGQLGGNLLDKLFRATPVMNVQAGTVNMVGATPGGAVPPGGGVPPGGATPMQKLGAAVTGAAVGLAIGGVVADSAGKDLDSAQMGRQHMTEEATRIQALVESGKASNTDRERGKQLLARMGEEQGKGALSRFGEGATAGIRGLAKGDVNAGNIASLIPVAAVGRGIVNAANGGAEAGQDSATMAASMASLEAALAKPTELAPGTSVSVKEVGQLSTAINGLSIAVGGMNGPKAQPPP